MPLTFKISQNKSNISIYDRYLSGYAQLLVDDPVILISKTKTDFEQPLKNFIEIKYKVKNFSTEITHRIYKLDNTEADLNRWIKNFEDLAERCEWTTEQQLSLMNELISPEIKSIIGKSKAIDSIKRKLREIQYPKTNAKRYSNELHNTHQTMFIKISHYYQRIQELSEAYGFCKGYKRSQELELIERTFYDNLSPLTEARMNETKITK